MGKKSKGRVGVAMMWAFMRSQVSKGIVKTYDVKSSPYPQCSIALEKMGHFKDGGDSYKTHCQKYIDLMRASASGFYKKSYKERCFGKSSKPEVVKAEKQPFNLAASTDFLQTYEWRKLRMEALKKYGPVCQCCGASRETGAVMNVDHIKPRKLFPQLALDINNLQILCHECNHGKGNWDMTDWRGLDENQREHLKSI